MEKARFSESQQPVKIIENGDMVTVFICLNGVEKTDENAFEESSTSYIEYDYNEFVEEKSLLDMDDIQKEYSTDEKANKIKKTQKDEDGKENEVFEYVLKDEFKAEYNEKINDINEKIQELGKEGEIYTLRVFDLDAFVDSNPNLTVDDLYMLTFMDENSEKIVEE